jgi:histidine triad (HIT) family protein
MGESERDCIFCKIADGSLATEFVVETEEVVAFRDIAPQAPTHVLIVPRRHIADLAALSRDDDALLGAMVDVARRVAMREGINESGFRLLTNVGPDAGQTVLHLHWHLLGGAPLGPLG